MRSLLRASAITVTLTRCACLHFPVASALQVFAVDSSDPEAVRARIRPVQSDTTLPEDFTTTNYVGEIKVDPTGRFVYVSNRGHNSIAVYSIDQTTGFLTPVAIQKTGGKTPRHFGLSPCGHYAVVGDQDSNVVRVFKVCPRNGTMEQVEGGEYPMGSPCFVMVSVRSRSRPLMLVSGWSFSTCTCFAVAVWACRSCCQVVGFASGAVGVLYAAARKFCDSQSCCVHTQLPRMLTCCAACALLLCSFTSPCCPLRATTPYTQWCASQSTPQRRPWQPQWRQTARPAACQSTTRS